MLKIGCHLSISDGFLGCAKTITKIGGNTFQYFSRNPQGGKARDWDQKDFLGFFSNFWMRIWKKGSKFE